MYLLLNVTCSQPDADTGCECAVLEVSRALCRRLQDAGKAVLHCRRMLPELHKVSVWRLVVDFYRGDLADDCELLAPGWREAFDRDGFALLPPAVDLERYEPRRAECDQEVVRYVGSPAGNRPTVANSLAFYWTAVPKHSDITVSTRDVSLPELRRQLAAARKAAARPRRRKAAG